MDIFNILENLKDIYDYFPKLNVFYFLLFYEIINNNYIYIL